MAATLDQFTHPAWKTIVGMGISYVLMLVVITLLLFLVPFLLFWAF